MRGGKIMLAVALTVATTVAGISSAKDKPAPADSEKSAEFEFFAPAKRTIQQTAHDVHREAHDATKRFRSPEKPYGFRWTPDGRRVRATVSEKAPKTKAGPIEFDAMRRNVRTIARPKPAPQQPQEQSKLPVITDRTQTSSRPAPPQADQFQSQTQRILRVRAEEPVMNLTPDESSVPAEGEIFGDNRSAPPADPSVDPGKTMFEPLADDYEAAPEMTLELDQPSRQPQPIRPQPVRPQPQPARPAVPTAAAFDAPQERTVTRPVAVPEYQRASRPVSMAVESVPAHASFDTPTSPLVTVTCQPEGEFGVGRECTALLKVRNRGASVAGNVIIEAYVPKTVKIISSSPKTIEQDTLTWTLGELTGGQEETIRVRMVPTRRGEMKMSAFVRYSAKTSATFDVEEPMLKVKITGPDMAQVGEATPHVITVSNPGSGVANNVVVETTVPEGLEHRRGEHLMMQVGALNPGESRNVRLALTAVDPGRHQIQVQATADSGLKDQSANMVAVVAPKLEMNLAGPAVRYLKRKARYGLQVKNSGDVVTSNVRTKYRVPEGFTFVDADRGGRYNKSDRTIEWFVGQMQPGEASQFMITLKPVKLGKFLHQGGAISEHGTTCSSELETRVEGVASLVLTIMDRDDPVELDQETMYEVRVVNEGSKNATKVQLTCDLPSGMTLSSVRGPANYFNRSGNVSFEALPSLGPGKAAVFQLVVKATGGGSQRFRARLTSDSVRNPLISEELTKVYND